jgi:DNA polymerase I
MSHQPNYFVLIDGHALIYRAYHAFPGLTTSQGVLVNAVYGFTRTLLTAIRDFQPVYLAVAFDHPKTTFRHPAFENYKANRVEMPDDLKPQIQIVKDVVTALNMPRFELEGFEADDLIGTLSYQAAQQAHTPTHEGLVTMIITGDRDAFQLVDQDVRVWMPGRGKGSLDTEYDREGVKARMDVYPEQIIDLKALMGDASDNIPGVKGIGEKTAIKLLQTFGTVDALYERVAALQEGTVATDEVVKGSVLTKLAADKDAAFMSRQLATIDRQVPIELDLEACRVCTYDKDKATKLLTELNFKSLVPLLPADEFELGIQTALF